MIERFFALARRMSKPPPVVGATPASVVHAENKWRLLRYDRRPAGLAHQTPVLLVPSLINRHYVLDLMPEKSFVEWLVARGHDVYCIDWGTPSDEDRFLTFEDITDRYIGRAVRVACRLSGVDKLHMLGYCLGGTLAVIHAAVRPEHIATLTLLATPVGFHDEGPPLSLDALAGLRRARAGRRGGQRPVAAHAVRLPPAAPHDERREGGVDARPGVGRRVHGRLPRARDVGQRQRELPRRLLPDIHRGALSR
jgi:pimeloyl-ACP methyl ester carboxylesterase